jgi:hypothetical protein
MEKKNIGDGVATHWTAKSARTCWCVNAGPAFNASGTATGRKHSVGQLSVGHRSSVPVTQPSTRRLIGVMQLRCAFTLKIIKQKMKWAKSFFIDVKEAGSVVKKAHAGDHVGCESNRKLGSKFTHSPIGGHQSRILDEV